jgi:hypothetical protein
MKPAVTNHLFDFAAGFVQDQAEWQLGKKLQTGAPTLGGALGSALSYFARRLAGWVPKDAHTPKEVQAFVQQHGVPKVDARHLISGNYNLVSPSALRVVFSALNISPDEEVAIKDEFQYIANTLADEDAAAKTDLQGRE